MQSITVGDSDRTWALNQNVASIWPPYLSSLRLIGPCEVTCPLCAVVISATRPALRVTARMRSVVARWRPGPAACGKPAVTVNSLLRCCPL